MTYSWATPLPRRCLLPTEIENLTLLPGSKNLTGANIELANAEDRALRLARSSEGVQKNYDLVVLDCPPALDLLTLNSLAAADSLIVPMQAEYFALEGISELVSTLERVRAAFNPRLTIEGVLLTMYDDRTNLAQQVTDTLAGVFQRSAVSHGDSAEYPAGGGAQPWEAGGAIRPAVARDGGLF